ncbi:DUF397 domain-containing protein [Lipingzhangella sp. LS1_29]|uniref:DUF397 domain-containing protein n=1 Tax=Lipingzhangella rawalii TaxID=2055835 RepID=A0ABU2H245_9ACTN|nr:DUF397 domain-containing protein [Lipingzhangella rawalii]MDS1269072.1 DUF397 domain-containing protein [Lipingzhangella rawalii]
MNADAWIATGWRTSSHSPSGGGSCVEVSWHISSYSANGNPQCVEAGPMLDGSARFAVRDSTQRERGFLSFGRTEWTAFVEAAKAEAL